MDSLLSPEARRILAASLVEQGMLAQRASIAVGLAAQACDRANDAFVQAIKLAPDSAIGLCATEIGSQLVTRRMADLITGTSALARAFGLSSQPVEVHL